MKLKDLILEQSRQSLYHWTYVGWAENIVAMNGIGKVEYEDVATFKNPHFESGVVSLTRDRYVIIGSKSMDVCFELDWDKLRARYKIRPYAYAFHDRRKESQKNKVEAEELLINGPIKPLDRYLIKIYIVPKIFEEVKNSISKRLENAQKAKEDYENRDKIDTSTTQGAYKFKRLEKFGLQSYEYYMNSIKRDEDLIYHPLAKIGKP